MRLVARLSALIATCTLATACVTLPDAAVGDESVRLLIGESETHLRELVAELSLPASPASDAAAETAATQAAASLDAARMSLLAQVANGLNEPGLVSPTNLAIMGVTLSICRESLRKIDQRMASDRDAASRLANGELGFLCLIPLGAVRGL